jgi:arginine deiminase
MGFGAESMWAPLRRVLLKRVEDAFLSQAVLARDYARFGYLGCPDYGEARRQYDAFLEIVSRHVPTLEFLPADERAGLDSLYTHDIVKVTRSGAILLAPSKILRQGEPDAARPFFQASDIPVLGALSGGARMEGGDVVWLDDGRIALGRGFRTNDAGIQAFRALIADVAEEVVVVPLPYADGPEACLHLMSVISVVDRNLAVVYSRYLPVFFRAWLTERGFSLIDVPDHEYDTLGTNVLALGPRLVVMLDGHPITEAALRAAGAEVLTYAGNEISFKGTGGPTCLTAPLWRSR